MCGFPRPMAQGTSRVDLAARGLGRLFSSGLPRTIVAASRGLLFRNHGQHDRKTAGRPRHARRWATRKGGASGIAPVATGADNLTGGRR
jgi:hypothetical protein